MWGLWGRRGRDGDAFRVATPQRYHERDSHGGCGHRDYSRRRPQQRAADGGQRRRERKGRQEAPALPVGPPGCEGMAVVEAELSEHAGDMRLDGLGAQPQPDGDLDVRPTLAQLVEDALLGGGEEIGVRGASTASSRHGATLAGDPPNYITRSSWRPGSGAARASPPSSSASTRRAPRRAAEWSARLSPR